MATEHKPHETIAKKTTRNTTKVPTSAAPVSTSELTGGTEMNAVIQGSNEPDLDEIRQRAYELYEADGHQDGKHHDHWYQAETEIRSRSEKKQTSRGSDKQTQRIA